MPLAAEQKTNVIKEYQVKEKILGLRKCKLRF